MSKQGTCRHCGREGCIEDHHVYPFKRYFKDETTIKICPNCHTDYHDNLPMYRLEKNQYKSFFISWLWGLFDGKPKAEA
jgi:hypothetical protein